jgi:hypothetical protein
MYAAVQSAAQTRGDQLTESGKSPFVELPISNYYLVSASSRLLTPFME